MNSSLKTGSMAVGLTLTLIMSSPANPLSGLDEHGFLTSTVPSVGNGFGYTRIENGVQIRVGDVSKNIIFYGPETVRVNANLGRSYKEHPSIVVVSNPKAPSLSINNGDDALMIQSEKIIVKVDKSTGALSFYRPDETLILAENMQDPVSLEQVDILDAPTYEVTQRFTLKDRESLYGLGQYTDPYWDYRGQEVYMAQSNIGICIPFLISSERYGILWDIYSKSILKDGPDGLSLYGESAPGGVDYYFMAGDSLDDVIRAYRKLTGAAPMFSKKSFGLWMSKERYRTQDQVIDVVKKFREAGFPLDNIVQDWQYWGEGEWGGEWPPTWSGMIWDESRYPDPAAMAETLHDDLNVQLMCSIWPSVGNDTDLARELDKYGLRHEPLHWISKKARIYDAYSQKGREIYYKHIKKGLFDIGVDALWMDGTEVEVGNACHGEKNTEEQIKRLEKNAMGDYTRYLNTYSLMTTMGVYVGQREDGNQRVFTLTRSAFTGQQRYGALSWSGDTSASYQTLKDQIKGGLNVCMAGQPYWTQDIGGFFIPASFRSGATPNREYNELYARWNQFGIFNPIYRIHGTDIDREPFRIKDSDPEAYDALLDTARLRYRLMPYIYGLGWQSTVDGYTMMRGMVMDFPDDPKVRELYTQFMFGPALLVNVVTAPLHRVPPSPAATIPAQALSTPAGGSGVAVHYFEGQNFDRFASERVEPTVDQIWPGPPLDELPKGIEDAEGFSSKWAGTITFPESGEYEIGGEGDDGVRIWIGDEQVVDDWGSHAMRWRAKRMTFEKGQKVDFRIEHFQGSGGRGLRLAWKTPSMLTEESGNQDSRMQVATYLPEGDWYDFWTNEKLTGGQEVERACPMDIFPLYVRAGSIVPMSPAMQYVDQVADAPYEIRIYPGADASFTFYEDDGETYDYEKGEYATVELTWNDAERTLTIGERKGAFSEMVKARTYRVVLATAETAMGIDEAEEGVKDVDYSGQKIVVNVE